MPLPHLQMRKLLPVDEQRLVTCHPAEPGLGPRSALVLSPVPHSNAALLYPPFSGLLSPFSPALLEKGLLMLCDPEGLNLLGTCSQHLDLVLGHRQL